MQRFYYGWVIVLACNLVACVTWGVVIFNEGIFVAYYVKAFGWSFPALSIAAVLFHLAAGGAGVLIGRIVDQPGPGVPHSGAGGDAVMADVGVGFIRLDDGTCDHAAAA